MVFEPYAPMGSPEWKAESQRLTEGRVRLVVDVLQRLLHESNPEKRAALIFLLGEYRATEATSVLVGIITFKVPASGEDKSLPLWGVYPAYEALVKIGVPSVPDVIKRLEIETDATAIRLGVSVICAVYGREAGELILKQALEKQSDQTKKANLDAARKLVRSGQ